jgi:hypothetical protein
MKKIFLGALVLALIISNALFGFPTGVRQALAAQATIDASISTAAASHNGGSPTTVFTSQSIGYAFYRDSGGGCAYSKTTNGGANWGAAVTVDSQTDCLQIGVWYDRWTPGDTTGNLIHIATIDSGDDDIWYRNLDTSSDTLSAGPTNITSGLAYAGTLIAGTNHVAIAKATDGRLFANVTDGSDNIMVTCTTTCTTAGNWAVSEPASWSTGNDYMLLIPRLSGEMMFIWWDISVSTNDIKYSRYTGTWSAFANIDTALDNSSYDASFGAAVNPSNGDIYLAYAADASTLGANDDIRVRKFSGTSWTALTDVVTNSVCAGVSDCGVTGAKISRDSNTGYLYVLYSAQSTPGTAGTGNLYWKYSTNDGSSWSSEFGPVYSTNDDIYGGRLSLMPTANERIYATWYAITPDDLFGRPIAPKTFEQSAYRLFNNADSTDVGTALAGQDTAATLGSTGAAFRLRMLLHIGVSDLFTNEGSFKLQFSQRGADNLCDAAFSGETYADVTAATVIAYNDNAIPADGAALTANANDPTHGTDVIVNQTYEEANNFTNSQGVINTGQDGKWDFSLKDNSAPASTAYCFRAVKSDGAVLNTYTVIPQITTATGASLTFVVTTDTFPDITPGTPIFATSTLSVDTNNSTGWNVTVSRDDADTTMDLDTDATVNITDQTAWVPGAATTTAGNAVQISSLANSGDVLALRVMTASGTQAFISTSWWGTTDAYVDSVTTLWAGFPSTAQKIGDSSVSCSGANCALNTVLYYLDVPTTQRTGAYSGGITYTATMNP